MSNIAESRLQEVISRGMAKAGPVIERVLGETPTDRISAARGLASGAVVDQDGRIYLGEPLHPHARGQLLGRLGIPMAYGSDLAVPDVFGDRRTFGGSVLPFEGRNRTTNNAWRRDLLQHSLREHLGHSDERFLLRSIDGETRGVMSDRYRRLDVRPLLDAFIGTGRELGMVPYDGVASDLSVSVRAIMPRVVEPVPGEFMVVGLSWVNSDFGARSYNLAAFLLRLVCLNGAVGETAIKQVHLGSRLPDNIELSAATYEHDTRTMVSATRDIVRGILNPAAIDRQVEAIRTATSKAVDVATALKAFKGLTKGESAEVKKAFDGPDNVMLPAGKTVWRFSNALSWVAHNAEPERKLELEAMAGEVLKKAA